MGAFRSGVALSLAAASAHLFFPESAGAQVIDPRCVPAGVRPSVLPAVIESASAQAPGVRGETLPRTGASLLAPLALGVLLVCVGILLVVLVRRRRPTSGVVLVVAVLGLVACLASGAAPAAAQVDPCLGAVPAPVIPESPHAMLLPLSAIALATGVAVVWGRRDQDARAPA